MGYNYTQRNGQRVEVTVAAAFDAMSAWFHEQTGFWLQVNDGGGTRTNEEQWKLYNEYLKGGTLAAKPPNSDHEEDGPSGPRALDISDTGSDAGVMTAGSYRANLLKNNCGRFGFAPDGYYFSQIEPWHYKYTGPLDGSGSNSGTSESFDQTVQNEQAWLISRGYNLGPSGADGIKGAATVAAYQQYQIFLRDNWGYTGDIDGDWGNGTQQAHQRYYDSVQAALNNGVPPYPLPDGYYFGPEGGGEYSVSGWHSHQDDLKRWQQRMSDRGWPITVDGLYGPKGATSPQGNTAEIALAFQKEKGYNPDSLIGKETWDGAWTSPVTPANPTPAPPVTTPPVTQPPTKDESAATPNLISPAAKDFPSWIKFDTVADPECTPTNNIDLEKYYGVPYNPVESHTHWWGEPGKSGTHDGNVEHIRTTSDLSVNFVVSENRVTLMVPLNKNAMTTGTRNPYAWKSENDPTLTEQQYKTMGYLHYIVEKLNPSLLNEPIRLHKEFYSTSCSQIDKAKVRSYAEKFHTGQLEVSTGLPPKTTPPVDPNPSVPSDSIVVKRAFLENMRDQLKAGAAQVEEVL